MFQALQRAAEPDEKFSLQCRYSYVKLEVDMFVQVGFLVRICKMCVERVNLFFHYVFSTNTFLPFTWFLLRPFAHFTLQFSQHVLSTDDDCAFYPMVFKSRDLHLSHSYILHYALYTIFNDAFYTKANRAFY